MKIDKTNLHVLINVVVISVIWIVLTIAILKISGLDFWWFVLISPVTFFIVGYIGNRVIPGITNRLFKEVK